MSRPAGGAGPRAEAAPVPLPGSTVVVAPAAPLGARVAELDALRGFASVAVVLHHLALTFPEMNDETRGEGLTALNVLRYSPLQAAFAGGPAVVLFFVLSGYVLHLSYGSGRRQTYRGFLARRVSRIWLPYIVWVAIAMILATLLGHERIPEVGVWFNERWQVPVDVGAIAAHLVLIAPFDDAQYDPVIWSLIHEMRISLVFPLLVVATLALGWARSLTAALLLALAGYLASKLIASTLVTFEYVLCFVLGIVLAEHRARIVASLSTAPRGSRWALLIAALLLFSWSYWFNDTWLPGPLARVAQTSLADTFTATASAGLLISLAQVPGRTRDGLRSRVPQFLGRISYSLYLLHCVVLLAVIHLLSPAVDPRVLLVPILVIVFPLAAVSERSLERPAQMLGRRWARYLE